MADGGVGRVRARDLSLVSAVFHAVPLHPQDAAARRVDVFGVTGLPRVGRAVVSAPLGRTPVGPCRRIRSGGGHDRNSDAPTERADVIVETARGLYCEAGGFYLDPWQPVERALVTHAHADHASPGSNAYLCAAAGGTILRRRLPGAAVETIEYGASTAIGGVRVSFHPAG